MKGYLILISIMINAVYAYAQGDSANTFVRQCGGDLMDHAYGVTSDSVGNIYMTGGFQSTSTFDDKKLISHGDTDIFIVKYNKKGDVEWLNNVGSDTLLSYTLSEYGSDILVSNDFIYVTGVFLSKAKFGATLISSAGGGDIFLAKYSLDGKLIWVKQAGGESQDIPHSITTDKYSNIYLTGSFQRTAKFGSEILSAQNSTEMFLAKYDQDGNVLWAKKSANDLKGTGKALQCVEEYCIVAGDFEGDVDFEDTKLTNDAEGVFVNRYTLEGDLIWSKQLIRGVQASAEDLLIWRGGIYITGSFKENVVYNGKSYLSNGNMDAYISKLDINGKPAWLNVIGGKGVDIGKSLEITSDNQILVGGTFQDKFKLNNVALESKGSDDIFLASYSKSGSLKWTQTFGGTGQDRLTNSTMCNNSIALAGYFMDRITIGGKTFTSNGSSDILLAQIPIHIDDRGLSADENIQIILYPNPTRAKFTVESEELIESIKIFNSLGELVYENRPYNSNTTEVILKDNRTGVYVVKVVANRQLHESKILIKNE